MRTYLMILVVLATPVLLWADEKVRGTSKPADAPANAVVESAAVAQNNSGRDRRKGEEPNRDAQTDKAARNDKPEKADKAARSDSRTDTASRDRKGMPPGLTPEREAAAMTFVRHHHGELVDLLLYLKDQQPAAYKQAILDLFRASERLAQAQERDYERYEVELELWKAESRIELLAARLKMAGPDSPEGETLLSQLKQLLETRHDLRLQRLALERSRNLERLDKLDKQLEHMQANRAQAIQRELQRLTDLPKE